MPTAPGTRGPNLLARDRLLEQVDALMPAVRSAFGGDAASSAAWLWPILYWRPESDARCMAMTRLVPIPMSLAVESMLDHEIPAGAIPAPHDPGLVGRYLDEPGPLAQHLQVEHHLA